MSETCYDQATHKPRLLSAQCETCIYRPGNLMRLRPGRLRAITEAALVDGCQGVICHDTLSYGPDPGFGAALCRGFYDAFGARSGFVRVIERIGGFTEVEPPADEAGRAEADR